MNRNINFWVSVIGNDDSIIIEKKVNHLPLKDELVIAKSIELFNDPEPCMIHRTAVMNRIFMEFFEYFEDLFVQSNLAIIRREMPETLKQMLDIKDEIKCISVRRC